MSPAFTHHFIWIPSTFIKTRMSYLGHKTTCSFSNKTISSCLTSWNIYIYIYIFCFFSTLCDNRKTKGTCNCVIVTGWHERLSVKKKKSLWAKIKNNERRWFLQCIEFPFLLRSVQVLYKYTVSKITAVPLMREYWDYCHLCLHIFLWLMSPKCCVFQMRTQFICMIFCTWCKFGDKLVSLPSLLAWHWVIFTEGVSEQYSQRITPVRYANH